MDINKSGSDARVSYDNGSGSPDMELRSNTRIRGTDQDEHDMRTLGKTQQLNVSTNVHRDQVSRGLTRI